MILNIKAYPVTFEQLNFDIGLIYKFDMNVSNN